MRAINIASEQLESAHASSATNATASLTLDLALATRALVIAVNAENRVIAGEFHLVIDLTNFSDEAPRHETRIYPQPGATDPRPSG